MEENLYTPNCIRTFTGHYLDPCNPNPEIIIIEDIAHALSMQPRFGGHLPVWYSVGQHSLKVFNRCRRDKDRLAALLHDASEAYLMDIPSPIKRNLSNYKEIEDNLMTVIALKFGFEYPLPEQVKEADKAELEYEWKAYMLRGTHLEGWGFKRTKEIFLRTYNACMKWI